MSVNNHTYVEIPLPRFWQGKENALFRWMEQLNTIFFFKNQEVVFDCFLAVMNKQVHLFYNRHSHLTLDFVQFVLANLPKNSIEKKRKRFDMRNKNV